MRSRLAFLQVIDYSIRSDRGMAISDVLHQFSKGVSGFGSDQPIRFAKGVGANGQPSLTAAMTGFVQVMQSCTRIDFV